MQTGAHEADVNELLRILDELAALLRDWGEIDWAAWMTRDRRLITESHPDALAHLLGAFGGPNNLRDLVITPAAGLEIEATRVRLANERLAVLRGAVFTRAAALRCEAQ